MNLGMLLFAVCFSGTMAVFSNELSWLVDPLVRVERPADPAAHPLSWQKLHDRTAEAFPQAVVLALYPPRGERSVARALIAYSQTDWRWVSLNPYTVEIQGLSSGVNLSNVLRVFHKQFYVVPSNLWIHGVLIVGALGLALFMAAVTGLVSLTRWWRSFVLLRSGRSARLFWSDVHRLTGVWALLVTVILSLTGVWYLAEHLLDRAGLLAHDAPPAQLEMAALKQRGPSLLPVDLDVAAARAQAAFPELQIQQLSLPSQPNNLLTFSGKADAWLVRTRANQVQIDPYTGEVLRVVRGTDLDAADRWVESADPLHFGTFAGVTSQLVWLVVGLVLCGGILAGLYGAWLRLAQKTEIRRRSWLVTVLALAPTFAVLACSVYGALSYSGKFLATAQTPIDSWSLGNSEIGPWRLSVWRLNNARESTANVNLIFEGPARPNFDKLFLWVGDAESALASRPVRRFRDRFIGPVALPPDGCADVCRLNVRIEDWAGTIHQVSIAMPSSAAGSAVVLPAARGLSIGDKSLIGIFVLLILLPLAGWTWLQVRYR